MMEAQTKQQMRNRIANTISMLLRRKYERLGAYTFTPTLTRDKAVEERAKALGIKILVRLNTQKP